MEKFYKAETPQLVEGGLQDGLIDFGEPNMELPQPLPSTSHTPVSRNDKRFTPSLAPPPVPFPGPNYPRCRIFRLNKAKAVTKNIKSLDPVVFQVYPSKGATYVGLDLGRDVVELKALLFFYGCIGTNDITAGMVPPEGVECYAFTREELDLYCPVINVRDQKLIPTQVSSGDKDQMPLPVFAVALQCVGMLRGKQCWYSVMVTWLDERGAEHTALSDAFLAVSHCINQRKQQHSISSSSSSSMGSMNSALLVQPNKKRHKSVRKHPKQRSPCPYCIEEGVKTPWQHVPKPSTLLLDAKQRDQALQKAWMKHYRQAHRKKQLAATVSAAADGSAPAAPLSLLLLSRQDGGGGMESDSSDYTEQSLSQIVSM